MFRKNHRVKHFACRNRTKGRVSMSAMSNSVEFGNENDEKEDSASTSKVKRRKQFASSSGYRADGDGSHGTRFLRSRNRGQDGEKEDSASPLKVKRQKLSASSSGCRTDRDGIHRTPILRSRSRVQEVTPTDHHPCTVLSWLIDNNMVLPRQKVYYCSAKGSSPLAEGEICREGIKCNCCQRVLTLGTFESHAGCSNYRPAANIFLDDGKSLLECQMQIMIEREKRSSRPKPDDVMKGSLPRIESDRFCTVCQDGGDLILCDRCPSVFHKSCIGLEDVPEGDWFCPACCCGICHCSIEPTIHYHTCGQCERKYHTNCWMERTQRSMDNVEAGSRENWFCSNNCQQIFLRLKECLGKQISVGIDNLTWSLWKSVKSDSDFPNEPDNDAATESYTKLNLALQVMQECFKQPNTGRHLAEDIIFNGGSNLDGMNFKGYYTMLLEKNDELITVATVRIYGAKVAEVPLIGTILQHRKKGMCRVLMRLLEKMLKELGVQRLVLPVVCSSIQKWNNSFGFSDIKGSDMLQFLGYRFMHFEDTTICQKCLARTSLAEPRPSEATKHVFSNEVRNCGFTSLISQDELHDQSKGSLVNDTCISKANVTVCMAQNRISEDQATGSATLSPVEHLNQGHKEQGPPLEPSSAARTTTGFEHTTSFRDTASSEQPSTDISYRRIYPSLLESEEIPDVSSAPQGAPSFGNMTVPQDTASFEQVYIELSDTSTDPSSLEGFNVMSSTSASELMNFRGLAKIKKDYVPLLKEVCSWHPSLIECQKDSSPEFTEWAFTALGKVLHFLKTKKVKDMTKSACKELERLYTELKAFEFDLTWLEPHVKTALDMSKHVERAAEVKRLKEIVNALEIESKRLEDKLVAAKNDLKEAKESLDERIMDCEMGYCC